MKWHILIVSVVLASFVIGSSLPEDSTVLGARDTNIVQQSLKSLDIDAVRLSELSDEASFDEGVDATDDEMLVGKKKSKKRKVKKPKKKKKKKKQKTKGKKSKASPTKTKKKKKS